MNDTLLIPSKSRETIECDVLIVGAGPAGLLFAASKLKFANDGGELSIIVLIKRAEPAPHIQWAVSGIPSAE